MAFAKRLARLREDAGLSQSALARAIGTSQSAISQIESGDRNPSYEMIRQIADALGLSPAYLLGAEVEGLTAEEQVHFRQYRSLPSDAREELKEFASYLRMKYANRKSGG
jgi:HTH-type transcriptional regulator, repressor for puuD